jgi:tetratricopeptide (TPR) repeat protein
MTILDSKKLNKLWAKSTDLNNPQRERHMFDLAFFLWTSKQFDEAVAVTGALLDLMDEKVGSSLWIDAMHLRSLALHDSKRDEEAIEAELKALEYGETLEPASERAFMHWHLADCYRTTEQPDLQASEYLKAIDAFTECENKFFLGQAYIDLGNLHYKAGRYLESKNCFQLAVPVLQETMRLDRMPFVKYRLAGVERHAGNLNLALSLAEEALELARFAKDVVAVRENLIELALVHEALGNYENSLSIFDSLFEDNDESIKNRSAAKAVYFRARILAAIGDNTEAINSYGLAIPLLKVVDLEELAVNAKLAIIHLKTRKD